MMDSMPMASDLADQTGMRIMTMVRAHTDSIVRMSPNRMTAAMPAHDQMMSQMLDRMGADMRGMHMTGDARWAALADSVKADLADLPGLQDKDLVARMTAHAGRVERLIAMHKGMMKRM